LTCQNCQTENRVGRKFCASCGQSLSQVCADCRFENDPGDRFCGGCGKGLGALASPAERTTPPPSPEPALRERRQVTILFADISSFTKISSSLDPEDTCAVLQQFFSIVDSVIERYGGTIDKHIGDAVMGLFGAPIAHADDPLRAVKAAAEIHEQVDILEESLPHPFKVHIGIAAGEVVAGGIGDDERAAYTVIGDSVNLAAHLQEHAGARETVISQAVHSSVAGYFVCDPFVMPDALPNGQKAWLVRSAKSGLDNAAVEPIVGRERELRHLEALLESARMEKRGEALLIRGEPGIGKTRLVQEFQRLAQQRGYSNHCAQVLDFGAATGQDAIRIIVRSLLGIAETSPKERRAEEIAPLLARGFVGTEAVPFLYDLIEAPAPPDVAMRYDAMDNATRLAGKRATLCRLISDAAADVPLMITVEDLHWAQSVTLDYLAEILDGITNQPVVVLMTSRLEGDPAVGARRNGLRGVGLFAMNLNPLGEKAAVQMATQYLGKSTKFVRDCITRADGNPLFLQQLLRSADDQGGQHLPATIQSLVLSRMDRLSRPEKKALQAASVAGQRIDQRMLVHLLGASGFDTGPLLDSQLMRADHDDLVFTHSLIRDGVYSSLLKHSARDLHNRAAAFYETRDPILHAEHLDKASDPAAASAYLEAARGALVEHHTSQAMLLVDRGLAVSTTAPVSYALQILKGDIHQAIDQNTEAVKAYKAALELAGPESEKCVPIIGMVRSMRDGHQLKDSLKLLTTAQDIATRLNQPAYLAQIHAQRGNLYFPRGQVDACLEEQKQSLQHAIAARSPKLEAEALSGLGDAEYMRGRMAAANVHFTDCVKLCEQHQFLANQIPNLALRGLTHFYCGLPETCIADCERAIEMAKGAHQLRAELVARTALAPALVEMAEFSRAHVQSQSASDVIEALGAHRFLPQCLAFKAKIAQAGGQDQKAIAFAHDAVRLSEQSDAGRSFTGPWAYGTLAIVCDDDTTRQNALATGRKLLEDGCVSHNHFWFYRDAIEAQLRSGDWLSALADAEALKSYIAAQPIRWAEYYITIAQIVCGAQLEGMSDDRIVQASSLRAAMEQARLQLAVRLLDDTLPAARRVRG